MAYRGGKQLTPVGCLAIGWLGVGLYPLLLVFNATGSWVVPAAVYLLPAVVFLAMNEGAGVPLTRVYFGPRGGPIGSTQTAESRTTAEEEIRRSREYYANLMRTD